jgi:hypothetical protein
MSGAADKLTRELLPNRRLNETLGFEHDGSWYRLTIGFYPDRRVGEIFVNHDCSNSLLDALANDAAIGVSLALQHGCSLETIRHALKRDGRGKAASPIGEALDRIAP